MKYKYIPLIGICLLLLSGCCLDYSSLNNKAKCKYITAESFCESTNQNLVCVGMFGDKVKVECAGKEYNPEFELNVKSCDKIDCEMQRLINSHEEETKKESCKN